MKQLILHVGFHKTATSSIQETCAQNIPALAELGYTYPIFKLGEREIVNHSIPFFSLFTERPEEYHINIRWEVDAIPANLSYLDQLTSILNANHQRIIISGEDIAMLSVAGLSRMKDFVSSFGYHILPVAVVRAPYSYAVSHTQESVKQGHILHSVACADQIAKVKQLDLVLPGIKYYPFAKACEQPFGPVASFFEWIGLSNIQKLNLVKRNESLSEIATRLISYINQECPYTVNGELNSARLLNDIHPLFALKGRKFQMDEDLLRVHEASIEQQNSFFRARFGDEFCDSITAVSRNADSDWRRLDSRTVQSIVDIKPALQPNLRPYVDRFLAQEVSVVSRPMTWLHTFLGRCNGLW